MDLRITVGDASVIPEAYAVRESVWEYSSTLTFVCRARLLSDITSIVLDGSSEFKIFSVRMLSPDRYEYVAYPKPYIDLLQTTFPVTRGTLSVKDLCSSLGVPYDSPHTCLASEWVLPLYRLRSLIDVLSLHANFASGGCPTFHFNLSGVLWGCDIHSESVMSTDPVGAITGTLDYSKLSTSFSADVPGIVDFYFYDEDSITGPVREVFGEGYGVGVESHFLSSSVSRDWYIRAARSRFWRYLYSNNVYSFRDVASSFLVVGSRVKAVDIGTDIIVTTVSSEYKDGVVVMRVEGAPVLKG